MRVRAALACISTLCFNLGGCHDGKRPIPASVDRCLSGMATTDVRELARSCAGACQGVAAYTRVSNTEAFGALVEGCRLDCVPQDMTVADPPVLLQLCGPAEFHLPVSRSDDLLSGPWLVLHFVGDWLRRERTGLSDADKLRVDAALASARLPIPPPSSHPSFGTLPVSRHGHLVDETRYLVLGRTNRYLGAAASAQPTTSGVVVAHDAKPFPGTVVPPSTRLPHSLLLMADQARSAMDIRTVLAMAAPDTNSVMAVRVGAATRQHVVRLLPPASGPPGLLINVGPLAYELGQSRRDLKRHPRSHPRAHLEQALAGTSKEGPIGLVIDDPNTTAGDFVQFLDLAADVGVRRAVVTAARWPPVRFPKQTSERPVEVRIVRLDVETALSEGTARAVVEGELEHLSHCASGADSARLPVEVRIRFHVGSTGVVIVSRLLSPGRSEAESCMSDVIRQTRFPLPDGGADVHGTLLLELRATN